MKLQFKKLSKEAKLPTRAKAGDAGIDLYAHSLSFKSASQACYGTGVAVEIPQGYVGLLIQRSNTVNRGLRLSNCVGVIDSNYRGEIMVYFSFGGKKGGKLYYIGDRVAQLVVLPCPSIEIGEANELTDTERGSDGFGSSGVK
jgi:dUTP pyrophosphatase